MQSKLYSIRKSKKLSQEEMAKLLNMSRISYGKKERGDVEFTIDEMFDISNEFQLPIDDIFLPRSNQNGYNNKEA